MYITLKFIDEIAAKLAADHPDLPALAVYLEAQTLAHQLAHDVSEILGYRLDDASAMLRFRVFPVTDLSPDDIEVKRQNEQEQIDVLRDAVIATRHADLYRQLPQRMLDLGVSAEATIEYLDAWCDFLRFRLP